MSQTHWFIDPSNSTGLASDLNDGASTRTPLLRWAEVVERYGGIEPIISQTTVFQFMSDSPNFMDPVVFRPVTINGASVFIYGGLVPVTGVKSGTLSNVVAKNRLSAQLLNADLGQPVSSLVGHILQNTTHQARSWIDAIGGSAQVAVLTQPLAPLTATPPTRLPESAPAEVDSFANSDGYTVVRPIKVNIADFRPVSVDGDIAVDNIFGFIQQVWIPEPVAPEASWCRLDRVIAAECRIDRWVVNEAIKEPHTGGLHNTWANGGGVFACDLFGGAIGKDCELTSVYLDGDVIVHSGIDVFPAVSYLSTVIGLAYIDGLLAVRQGAVRLSPGGFFGTGESALWGPGKLNAAAGGSFYFDTSATSQILTTGPLLLDGQTNNGTSYNPANGTFTGGHLLSVANIDAAPGKALFNPHTGSRYAQYQA